ncbi:ABC transporter permease [Streptomyces sp. 4N509B]|uniref:ABC transporter permease n=1 Tax=Streptomyces sp. 4N509B TaxID=3457413 RepID=UPI003FCFA98A
MTTLRSVTRPPADHHAVVEPRPRFVDLLAAEWIKLRSLRSTWIAYACTAVAVVAFNVGSAYDAVSHWQEADAAYRAEYLRDGIPLQHAFTANSATLLALALTVLGALGIVGEYGTGTIRTTFAAVPARRSVMAAKAAVVALATTVFGLLVAATSFLLTQAVLDGKDVGLSIGDAGAPRVVLASALLAPVCALTGLALGAALRYTATTMVVSVLVVLVLPISLTDGRHWSAVAAHTLPFEAWLRLTLVNDNNPTAYPWTTGGAWTVYGAWAVAATAVAVVSVHRRDH